MNNPATKPDGVSGQPSPANVALQTGQVVDTSRPLKAFNFQLSSQKLMLVIFCIAACAELAYTTVNISAMAVYIRDGIQLDTVWIGIAATAFILVEGVLKSPFGLLGDRIGRKPLILAGPLVSIFTCLLTPHVRNPFLLVTLRVLDGIGAAALWPATFSLIGDCVPEERRSAAMSYYNLAYLLGLALGPLLGGSVNQSAFHHLAITWRESKQASFYVAAFLFALTSVIAIFFLPSAKRVSHPTNVHQSEDGGFSFQAFKKMLGRMPMTLLMTFVTFLGIGLIMAYVKVFAMETFHLDEAHFGALLIGPALAIAILSIPLGTLGDKIGKAEAVKVGIGLCAASYLLLIIFHSELSLVVFGSLLGHGFVMAFPAWMALVITNCNGTQRGAAVGAVGTAQGLGAIVGVIASSFLYRIGAFQIGSLVIPQHGLPFLGCAVMLTLSFILALTSVHNPPQDVAKVAS